MEHLARASTFNKKQIRWKIK